MSAKCSMCGGSDIVYASFSGGREYYCYDCKDNASYEPGTAPRRVGPNKALRFKVNPGRGMDEHDWADIQRQITLAISDILMEYYNRESAKPSVMRVVK